jgi:alpha,alpha-trehalase
MRKHFLTGVIIFLCSPAFAQLKPQNEYPILFSDVQLNAIFPDSKTFVDGTPLISANQIDSIYLIEKEWPGFSLADFVNSYFFVPSSSEMNIRIDTTLSTAEHIENMWPLLERSSLQSENSLLPLPAPYIVPGGRFREVYYWDAYFTMLGLAVSEEYNLIQSMVKNFAYLIDTFEHIPNGNRTYYLSRSQPPYFALMLHLLAKTQGDSIAIKFLPQLEKEYQFWMKGKEYLSDSLPAIKRVVRVGEKTILNRYWDDENTPRPESYLEDYELMQHAPQKNKELYREIRAACESGWDFSSRWMADNKHLHSLETTSLLPVDLNCLMYNMERTLAYFYGLSGNNQLAGKFEILANLRKEAINKIFWHKGKGFYADYNFISDSLYTPDHLSGIYPMYFKLASKHQAKEATSYLIHHFLMPGGLSTSVNETGQQWDHPNGWAPLQYIAVMGLYNYNEKKIAIEISERWMSLIDYHFDKKHKLLEKYNVANLQLEGGGGEYPTQDGFGWTNGVYLFLKKQLEDDKTKK